MTDQPPAPASTPEDDQARLKRNLPSLLTDIGLGAVFFVVGTQYGLVAAAVGGAAAGVVLFVVQKLTRIDLLGGLALFGIGVSLVSAAFALAFQDPAIVQLRGTIIGLAVAGLFLGDGLFYRGRLLGARIIRYMPAGSLPHRIALGVGVLGAIMAGANWVVARLFTEQQWLFYTSFLDTPLAMALGVGVMLWARRPAAKPD